MKGNGTKISFMGEERCTMIQLSSFPNHNSNNLILTTRKSCNVDSKIILF